MKTEMEMENGKCRLSNVMMDELGTCIINLR